MGGNKPEKITYFGGRNAGFNKHSIDLTPAKKSLTHKSKLSRMLEKNIISHLEAAGRDGLGKGELKKLLMAQDDYMNISINTVKRVVNRLLEEVKIECVNPDKQTGLLFRLKVLNE